jgi:hypothetical protein
MKKAREVSDAEITRCDGGGMRAAPPRYSGGGLSGGFGVLSFSQCARGERHGSPRTHEM